MINKLSYLTQISLSKKMKTKWFLWANIILLIAIVGLLNIDNIVKFFGGDFSNNIDILVIDNTNNSYDYLETTYKEYTKTLDLNTTLKHYSKSYDDAIKEIKDTDNLILVLDPDPTNYLKANLIANSTIDTTTSQILTYSLNSLRSNIALTKYNLSKETLDDINGSITLTKTLLNKDNSADSDLIMNVVFPLIILPFFMLTMFLVQMIGAEINEEKTTKSMEIIISNVSSRTHFFSKLLAGNIFVLSQGLLLIIYLAIGLIIRFILGGGTLLDNSTSTIVTQLVSSVNTTGLTSKLAYLIPITIIININFKL